MEETLQKEQITSFHAEVNDASLEMPSNSDPTFLVNTGESAEIAKFLSRPVKISTISWTVGGALDTALDPWYLYLNHSTVKNKIQNYEYLKADLNIKVLINASPFYYGAALVSYRPLKNFTYGGSTPNELDNCIRSQRPHIWIYPQTNQGGELTLPFFYYNNYLNLTSAADAQNFGELEIDSFVNLRNANSVAGTDVDIQIYAWLTDVTLSCPTVDAALQGGTCTKVDVHDYSESFPQANVVHLRGGGDEYQSTGPISGPASAVSSAARALESIPMIEPFARATSVIAAAVSGVAAYFGFTKTPVIKDVEPFKNLPFHSFASTEIGEPIEKLTFDPKNELSIDPRITGLDGTDEMNLKHLVQKESYFGIFTWSATATAGTKLFNLRVGPMLPVYDAGASAVVLPPVSHFSSLFKYWRGSLVYRFKIICSQYHRGRIQVYFDPSSSGSLDPSVQYNEIFDITNDLDFEVTVPYIKDTPWTSVPTDATATYFNTGVLATDDAHSTGNLSLAVNTQQTSPVSTADIFVLCYVRAGDDFELGCPQELSDTYHYFDEPQSGVFPKVNVHDFSKSYPQASLYENPKKVTLWDGSTSTNPNTFHVCMGEKIASLRTILRRVTNTRTVQMTTDTTNDNVVYDSIMSRYPLYNGYDPNGINTANNPTNNAYNYVHNIPFNWIVSCFVASRGSINWYVDVGQPMPMTLRGTRNGKTTLGAGPYHNVNAIATGVNASTRSWLTQITAGFEGMSVMPQRAQSGFGINVPFYSKRRFRNNLPSARTEGIAADESNTDALEFHAYLKPSYGSAPTGIAHYYMCIGEDFGAHWFINTPKLYIYAIPPV